MTAKTPLPTVSKVVIALLVLLSFGPFFTGLDLAFNFLPTRYPAIQNLHVSSLLGRVLWVGSGFLGVIAIFMLARRKAFLAMAATIVFAAIYVPGANMVWFHFTPGCWLAIAAAVLSAFGAIRREG